MFRSGAIGRRIGTGDRENIIRYALADVSKRGLDELDRRVLKAKARELRLEGAGFKLDELALEAADQGSQLVVVADPRSMEE